MAPSLSRVTLGGVVLASCILLSVSILNAQNPVTPDRAGDAVADPVPDQTSDSPADAPVEGHASEEGGLDSDAAAARELWTRAQDAAALRAAITAAETSYLSSLASLQARFDSAASDAQAMDLQRQIEALKFDHEVRLVTVQAEHARATGRTELADEADRLAVQLRAMYLAQQDGPEVPASEGAPAAPDRN